MHTTLRMFPVVLATVFAACHTSPGKHANEVAKPDAPIACSLTPDQLKSRRDELLPGLIRRADAVTDLENGLRMQFKPSPGLLAELTAIVEQERGCCNFLRFQLTVEAGSGPITFDVSGPAGTREMLRAL